MAAPPGYMLVPMQPAAEAKPTTPVDLPYEEGRPAPPGYRIVEKPRKGLIIAGALVAGIPWGLSITVAAANNFEDSTALLLLPAVGPWLTLAAQKNDPCDVNTGINCVEDSSSRGILVLDGLMQTTGAVLFVIGISSTTKKYLRNDVISGIAPARFARESYGLSHDAYGLSMRGSF